MRKLFYLLFIPLLGNALSYEVRFIGLEDKSALQSILETSQLVSLQHRPPASINGLRYRMSADIPSMIKVLHAYAYYDASITSSIENTEATIRINLFIHPGPQFTFASYNVYGKGCQELSNIPGCCPFTPEQLGIKLGEKALSEKVINAELNTLSELSKCGYPLASVIKRRVEVDMKDHTVHADSCVDEGPFTTFGPTTYFGIQDIKPRFIQRKLSWKEGCPYDSDLLIKTQERLLKTELFSSVLISHGNTLDEKGELPLRMRITEARHKKVTFGAFYATVNGFGGNFTWTHRNIRGMGEILSTKLEYAQKSYSGIITYKKPDFLSFDQTYRALAEVNHEKIHAYNSFMYRFANYIDRPLPPFGYVSFGVKMDHINVSKSATDGTYFLIGLPLFGKYERADDPLDPKSGYTLSYSMTPYQSLISSNVRFAKQRLTGTCYIPLFPNKKWILALRMQAGSIAGTRRENVPLPKLFLGGSEDDLRGYKYQSVSPLKGTKPLGGRSAIFTSAELRIRILENIGVVPFADFGTVTNSELPSFDAKWFKSVGIGLRYFAFFGPLRFDIGFPLDRRKHIDSKFQIYSSVGQAF
jgi:translocation and assembly module TamA